MSDVGNGGYVQPQTSVQPDYGTRSQAMAQPYPSAPQPVSPARRSSQPAAIERAELAAPSSQPSPRQSSRDVALAQPMPSSQQSSGTLRVPHGGNNEALVTGSNPARSSAEPTQLPKPGHAPAPQHAPEQKVALLPKPSSARVKEDGSADQAKAAKNDGDPGLYTVQPGDSLAKIARNNGVSVDSLKSANNLDSMTVRVGQKLRVPATSGGNADNVKTASVPAAEKPAATPAVAQAPAASAPAATASAPASADSAPSESMKQVASADPQANAPQSTGIGKYRWPVTGAVIAKYGQNVDGKRSDGIDISVPEGTPIKAAENGVVIYAGNGLKELGNTVLVRHSDGTVTVYGNADGLSVQRGQKVQRGQQIAKSGMSGSAKRPQVHFEVRKDASPVDPMTFLE